MSTNFNAATPSPDPTADSMTGYAPNREDTVQTLFTSTKAHRQRTIILSIILIIFFALTIPYFADNVHNWCSQSYTFNADQIDLQAQCSSADALLLWASLFCIGSLVAVITALYAPALFNGKIVNVSGCVLTFSGFLYIVGWILAIVVARESEQSYWDNMSATDRRWKNCIC